MHPEDPVLAQYIEHADPDPAPAGPSSGDVDYFDSYADAGVHRVMLADHVRTDAYRAALEKLITPETVVLDVGAGSGILSCFAARAGARRVHAVEASPMAEIAERIAIANGYGDRIVVHRVWAEALSLPDPVDLIVSEWMGYFALAELMWESVLVARDKHLSTQGLIIPGTVHLDIATVSDGLIHRHHGLGMWSDRLYGLDFTPMYEHELRDLLQTSPGIGAASLSSNSGRVASLDCEYGDGDSFWFDGTTTLKIEKTGTVHGLAGWFDAELAPGVTLTTAPHAPRTHWRQAFFPLPPFEAEAGDELEVRMRAKPRENGDSRLPLYFVDAEFRSKGRAPVSFYHRYYASFE